MAKLKDWNPEYSLYVREVSILFKRSPGIMPPPKDFVKELPDTLASILSRISSSSTRLSKMAFNTDQHTVHSFKKAFARAQHQHRDQRPGTGTTDETTGTLLSLSFPTVICLTVGPYNEFIVQHCPNIRHISDVPHSVWGGNIGHAREHIMNLIEEARKIENLESFVIREALTEELMNALYSSIPRIKTLAILRHSILYMSFEDFVSTHLSRFRHLRILSIPDVSHLDVGYSPPQWGGFSPRPDADEIRKRIDEGKQARERVARAIFEACPLLKELWFEDRIRASVKAKGGTGVGDVEKAVNSNTRTRELAFSKGRNDCDCEPPTFMFLSMCADFS
ncbi:hypothetical protein D9758_008772 [Tetrapyrgos nigripes]|uniref:Uncharacterized protein n=1 Tax=Tetrapyrgos nigripes TaxID=182062 RepID=A0A8H5FY85_9AGAR|nr:hypothetical protein D9758_008772 [Tetrapyrgos nigripes]